MPNLFAIGSAKCGTTSLHHYLDAHPEISMSSVKEPGFFLQSGHPTRRIASRDDYLGLFEAGFPVRGESSVAYTGSSGTVAIAERMAAEAPKARLIYLVRDPVEKLLSGVRMNAGEGRIGEEDLRDGLEGWLGDPRDRDNPRLLKARYMTQIRSFLEWFPERQLLVIDSDRLKSERNKAIQETYAFLDVDPTFTDRSFRVERNTSAARATGRFNRIIRTNEHLRRASTVFPEQIRQRLIRSAGRLTGREIRLPDPSPGYLEALRDLYRPEVAELREFTGQDFAGWSI